MSLGSYARQAVVLVEELRELLTESDERFLREALSKSDRRGWLKWMMDNDRLVYAYIAATPSERRRAARFRLGTAELGLLRLAALARARMGAEMLRGLSSTTLQVGDSYRVALSLASQLADDVLWSVDPLWPLGEPSPWK